MKTQNHAATPSNEYFDAAVDLLLYIAILLFFHQYPIYHPLLLPAFVFASFIFFIVLYEIVDWSFTNKHVELSWKSSLNSIMNIGFMSVADGIAQRWLTREKIGDLPLSEFILTPFIWFLTQEVSFYFLHRLSHHPTIYPHVHKQHHKYRVSRALYCQYVHLFELLFIEFIDMYAVFLVMRPNYFVTFGISAVMIKHNVSSHRAEVGMSNEEAGRHAMHHRDGRFNFGNLSFLDKWLGTEYAVAIGKEITNSSRSGNEHVSCK